MASHGLVTMTLYRPDFLREKMDVVARTIVDSTLMEFEKI